MVDLTGFPALDVLLGLAFVYFLLSIVTSAMTEMTSALLQLRWRTLQRGMRELMLSGKADEKVTAQLTNALELLGASGYQEAFNFANHAGLITKDERTELQDVFAADRTKDHEHAKERLRQILDNHGAAVWSRFENDPRMRALWKQTGFLTHIPIIGTRGPSYIQPRVFALTLLDTLAPPEDGSHGHDVVAQAEAAAASVRNPLLKKWLADALAEAAEDVEKKREKILASIESSFDAVTNRVSGWYKRYATIWVLVFSILVAGALNADSYVLGKRLWQDQAVRNAVATQAASLTAAKCPSQAKEAANAGATPVGKARLSLDQASRCVSDVQALGLPFGWDEDQRPDWSWTGVGGKLFGLIITVFALMLGAPFWFDTLGRLARLRTTGKPEGTAKGGPT